MDSDFIIAQRSEITGKIIYERLSNSAKNPKNKKILKSIAKVEQGHYDYFKEQTKQDVKPYWFQVWLYIFLSKLLGLSFGVKLMEREEQLAQVLYKRIAENPIIKKILEDEEEHEDELLSLLEEKKLAYIGSIVLGLNDALVELTGALAGFTLAFQDSRLVAVAGLITGIAASFSMAASEYLSTKAEPTKKKPITASVYTGIAYITTVSLLILPFLLLNSVYLSLILSLCIAVAIIFMFTFYSAVVENTAFFKRFAEMVLISLGVAALTFGIGYLVRIFLGLNI